jgi:hypothetical protein
LGIAAGQIVHGQATGRLDWEQVPERLKPALSILWKAVGPMLWILLLLCAWSQWRHEESWLVVTSGILVAVVFAWEALFFAYGDMRADDGLASPKYRGNVLKS